jgi:integrase
MRKVRGRRRVLSEREVIEILDKAEPREKALVCTLYLVGCRINEALKLRAEDIREDQNRVFIRIAYSKREDKKGKFHVVLIKKSDKNREFLDPILYYIEGREGLLFNITRQRAWQKLKQLNPELYPHLFRHTRATRLAERGATSQQLKVYFGWNKTGSADPYVEETMELIKDLEVD